MADLSEFITLPGLDGAFVARKGSLRCTAFQLLDNSLCLFSPVAGLGDAAKESLSKIGDVSYLFAPNHYHNKAVGEYLAAYPNATLCCSDAAKPRLEEVTGFDFKDLSGLDKLLPKRFSLVEPEGLKTGEVWVVAGAKNNRTWFVVDAFGGAKMGKDQDRISDASYLKTFPNFGVKDKALFSSWAKSRLKAEAPNLIVPCHGAIMAGDDLSNKAIDILDQMFR